MAEQHDDAHISISPVVFYLLLGAAGFGGLGGGSVLSTAGEKPAIQACIDNSQELFSVAVQHGEELQILRKLLYDRTGDRYTTSEARDDWEDQFRRDDQQDRRIEYLEGLISK